MITRTAYLLAGPTASGKSAIAVVLAREMGAWILSAASMLVYAGMDIGTAKPSPAERAEFHMGGVDVVTPADEFSSGAWLRAAAAWAATVPAEVPIVIVGGTGLYYSSLVDNIEFLQEETDFEYRELLKKRAETEGADVLLSELREIDPEAAEKLHVNNLGRIIRALEIHHSTGKTKTMQNEQSKLVPSPYKLTAICLDARNRQYIYDRINRRVDIMLECGLLKEAENFYNSPLGRTAKQAIGYKELTPYFEGTKSLDECIDNLKMQTRRYAKRQLTWFRRDERIKFLYIDDYSDGEELLSHALEIIEKGDAY